MEDFISTQKRLHCIFCPCQSCHTSVHASLNIQKLGKIRLCLSLDDDTTALIYVDSRKKNFDFIKKPRCLVKELSLRILSMFVFKS